MSAEPIEAGLSDDEARALELVRERGVIHQSAFWKELDVSSRKGSRLATSLEEAGLIKREETVYEGNRTYRLEPVVQEADLDFSLLMAGDMLSPFVGEENINPESDRFSQWIMNLVYEE
ncbi:MAG: helix-turn-helix transcriptional regulator [Halodesulfurarchaeum sp.]